VVIEAVGIEKTVQQSMRWVSRGGKVVIVGLSEKMMGLDMHEIVNKEVRIEGSFLYGRIEFLEILKRLSDLKPGLDKNGQPNRTPGRRRGVVRSIGKSRRRPRQGCFDQLIQPRQSQVKRKGPA